MHTHDENAIAINMFSGASFGRSPESLPKNVKYGIFIPACWKTPAEAKSKHNQMIVCPFFAASAIMIALLINPQNKGTEMENAPTIQNPVVHGIDLNKPPK